MRVQMLGLCRFSYVGLRGYQKDHASIEARRAFLYDPARLARRWRWFTEVALPGWLTQSDPDFTLVIMTGPDLPQPYLSQLDDLAAEMPQIRLALMAPDDRHLRACRDAVAPHVDPAADVIGHFRHDDDDAVALDYIASARRDFRAVQGIWQRERRLSLDYSRGLMMRAEGGRLTLTPRICHNMGVALTLFLDPAARETALHYNHVRLARWMPGIAITQPLMFLRSIHGDSDSGDMGPGLPFPLSEDRIEHALRSRFGLDLSDLREMTSGMADPEA